MSVYTYTGNLLPGEKTERLVLRGGALVLDLGNSADLTPEEFTALSGRYRFTAGAGGTLATPGKASFKFTDLLDVFATPADLVAGKIFKVNDAGTGLVATPQSGVTGVILPWAPNTAYKAGQPVINGGVTWTAKADFTSGGVFSGATNWTPLPFQQGVELGYAEITASAYTARAGADLTSDVAGLSVTVTVGARPIRVMAGGGYLQHVAAGGAAIAQIVRTDTSAVIAQVQSYNAATANVAVPWAAARRLALAAGAYTFKVRLGSWYVNGNAQMAADPTFPAWLHVIEV